MTTSKYFVFFFLLASDEGFIDSINSF